jgi:hypothetical protein
MQINLSQSTAKEVIKDIPAKLLAALADGQKVQATVLARLSADTVKVQVAETLLTLSTRLPVQRGQQLLLQKNIESGLPVLRVAGNHAAPSERVAPPPVLLSVGQQVAVEVVKRLPNDVVLVAPRLVANNTSNTLQSEQVSQPVSSKAVSSAPKTPQLPLPRQIEVDVRAIKQTLSAGDKLSIEVIKTTPLTVQLKRDVPTRAETIQQLQRAALPEVNPKPNLTSQLNALSRTDAPAFKPPIQQAVSNFVENVKPRQTFTQPEGIKQALTQSGVFLEQQLKSLAKGQTAGLPPLKQDIKANLLQFAQVLKTALADADKVATTDKAAVKQSLPIEIRQALQTVSDKPELLRPLVAQVQTNVERNGQTPIQLLVSLLSSLKASNSQVPTTPTPQISSSPTETAELRTQMLRLEAAVANSTNRAAQAETVLRALEFQVMRDLLREVESATARLQINQLSMVRDTENPTSNQVWLFDLPVRDKQQLESMQMRIERKPADDDDDVMWEVALHLETQNLGPMQALISLYQGQVKVVLLAERLETTQRLNQDLHLLDGRLTELGMTVSHLSCRQAPIQPMQPEVSSAVTERLLDVSV